MKLRLLTTQDKSETAELLANTLTDMLGYKVFRSEKIYSHAIHVQYGDPRTKDWQYMWMKTRGLPGPEFTFERETAVKWVMDNHTVIARQKINGQDGGGIIVIKPGDAIPDAKVYTKYFEATHEYRVMLFQDRVIAMYEKLRKNGFPKHILRTTTNGYILGSIKTPPPITMLDLAKKFCYMNRSDLKGIDIIYNAKNNEMLVLEINSAPAMGPLMCSNVAVEILKTFPEELA